MTVERRRKKMSMTASDFAAVRHLVNISEDRIEAARLILVEDRSYEPVAEQFGWKGKQAAYMATKAVWDRFQDYQRAQAASSAVALPKGWERIVFTLPTSIIDHVYTLIAEAQINETGLSPLAQSTLTQVGQKKPAKKPKA